MPIRRLSPLFLSLIPVRLQLDLERQLTAAKAAYERDRNALQRRAPRTSCYFHIPSSAGGPYLLACTQRVLRRLPLPLHGVETGPDLDALFPLGQLLAIKDPTFKINEDGRVQLIRVDSPPDLVFLESGDPLLSKVKWIFPSPGKSLPLSFDSKAHGNSLFKQKNDEHKLLLHLNRAQANLLVDNFASASRDASAALALLAEAGDVPPQTKLKATLRRARALEGLRMLEQSKAAFDQVLKIDKTSIEGKNGRSRLVKMLREAQTGEYDWTALRKEVKSDVKLDAHCGNVFGGIEVAVIEKRGGGRGVVAQRAVKAGEVLLVEKAFAVGNPPTPCGRIVTACNPHRGSSEKPSDLALADAAVARIVDDPSTLPLILSLHGGSKYPPTHTATFDSLACRDLKDEPDAANIDIASLEEIATTNCFGLRMKTKDSHAFDSPSGLFLSATLFNHACDSNAFWLTYQDLIVVCSRTSITAGRECSMRMKKLVGVWWTEV
ncbi:hypothetical protein JCM11641_007240 [Rhodosporidiobolus odoratus]